jgi:hypothetical protein
MEQETGISQTVVWRRLGIRPTESSRLPAQDDGSHRAEEEERPHRRGRATDDFPPLVRQPIERFFQATPAQLVSDFLGGPREHQFPDMVIDDFVFVFDHK